MMRLTFLKLGAVFSSMLTNIIKLPPPLITTYAAIETQVPMNVPTAVAAAHHERKQFLPLIER